MLTDGCLQAHCTAQRDNFGSALSTDELSTMENPDKRPLPPGWITQYDSRYSAWYYVNTSASPPVTVWEHPLGAPPPAPPPSHYAPPPGPPPPNHNTYPGQSAPPYPSPGPSPGAPPYNSNPPNSYYGNPQGQYGGYPGGGSPGGYPGQQPSYGAPPQPHLLLSRIGSKRRRLSKEGKARRDPCSPLRSNLILGLFIGLFGGLFGKKPSSGYGGGGYGQQPQVVYAQQPAKSGGGMGMGGMLAAGGAGLIGGALIANAIDDSQEDAYREGYEDAQDGGGFDDDF
ncbi:hypothetical protein EYR40_005811 [Pleurotus pulmonarius]|nr:hypothetical protein EYR36_005799 [Pleurotus pulmonarius]KAF4602596.1 hypothetical protein EYR40_005811 [Pleurotus pulmonarius]